MIELVKAIKDHWDGDATLTALDLYYDLVPEGSSFPCARQSLISTELDDSFGTRHMEESIVQLDVFAATPATVKTYLDALESRFDRATFIVTGGVLVSCDRDRHLALRLDGISSASEKVYRAGVQYRVRVNFASF